MPPPYFPILQNTTNKTDITAAIESISHRLQGCKFKSGNVRTSTLHLQVPYCTVHHQYIYSADTTVKTMFALPGRRSLTLPYRTVKPRADPNSRLHEESTAQTHCTDNNAQRTRFTGMYVCMYACMCLCRCRNNWGGGAFRIRNVVSPGYCTGFEPMYFGTPRRTEGTVLCSLRRDLRCQKSNSPGYP